MSEQRVRLTNQQLDKMIAVIEAKLVVTTELLKVKYGMTADEIAELDSTPSVPLERGGTIELFPDVQYKLSHISPSGNYVLQRVKDDRRP